MRATVRRSLGGGCLNTADCRELLPTCLNCKLFFSVEIQIVVLTFSAALQPGANLVVCRI
jgi:hypothetical protein